MYERDTFTTLLSSGFTQAEYYGMATAHLSAIKEKIMKSMAAECSQGDVPECPIVDALFDRP